MVVEVGGGINFVPRERYQYTPYGEVTFLEDDFDVAGSASAIGNEILYTGRTRDSITGLYDYRTRFYHAPLGRFTSRDWIEYGGGMNLYGYVGGMPTGFVDPWGLQNLPGTPSTQWHHLLPQGNWFTPWWQAAQLNINDPEFGWIIDDEYHKLLHNTGNPKTDWNLQFQKELEKFRRDHRRMPRGSEVRQLLETMKTRFNSILNKGKQANLSYKEWEYWRRIMREAADKTKKSKKMTQVKIDRIRRVGGRVVKWTVIVTFIHQATTDSVSAATESTVSDLIWPFGNLASEAADYAAGPLRRTVEKGQEHRKKGKFDPYDPGSYRPHRDWPGMKRTVLRRDDCP